MTRAMHDGKEDSNKHWYSAQKSIDRATMLLRRVIGTRKWNNNILKSLQKELITSYLYCVA